MKLRDALRGMPERTLRAYRQMVGLAAGADVALADLAQRLADPARVRSAIAQLDPPALSTLRILWYQGERLTNWTMAATFRHLHPGASVEQALSTLIEQGLLLPVLSAGRHLIPEELRPVIQGLATAEWLEECGFLIPAGQIPTDPRTVDPAVAVADFARFLGALRAGVRVRQQDPVPFVADQRRLAGAMDTAGYPPLPAPSRAFPMWGGYLPEVGFSFAAAMSYDLLEARGNLWATSPRAERWIQRPPAAQWAGLLPVWVHLTMPTRGTPMASALTTLVPEGVWCRPERLLGFAARYQTHAPDAVVEQVRDTLIRVGGLIGALELSRTDGDTPQAWAVRLRPEAVRALEWIAAPERPLPPFPEFDEVPLVQGTYEVLAGPRVPIQTIWALESWGERVGLDRFATYRLTQRAALAAARRGGSVEALLALLADSPGGVPQNVAFSLREWCTSIVHVGVAVGVVLRAPDAAVAERIAHLLARYERLGPLAWLIPADGVTHVWRLLTGAGCEIPADPAAIREQLRTSERQPAGTFAPQMPWPGFPEECPLPGD